VEKPVSAPWSGSTRASRRPAGAQVCSITAALIVVMRFEGGHGGPRSSRPSHQIFKTVRVRFANGWSFEYQFRGESAHHIFWARPSAHRRMRLFRGGQVRAISSAERKLCTGTERDERPPVHLLCCEDWVHYDYVTGFDREQEPSRRNLPVIDGKP